MSNDILQNELKNLQISYSNSKNRGLARGRSYRNYMIKMKFLLIILLFVFLPFFAFAEDVENSDYQEFKTISLKNEFFTTKNWHITAFQANSNVSDIPAKICFWFTEENKQKNCTKLGVYKNKTTYKFQTIKELSVVSAAHFLKLVAEFSGGGSGSLQQISLFKYDKKSDLFALSKQIIISEQGEYKITNDGLLITADALQSAYETHFSPHHFHILVYKFEADRGFKKIRDYITKEKYPSFDDVDKIDVISHELKTN